MAFDRYEDYAGKRLSPTRVAGYWGQRLLRTIAGSVWSLLAQGATNAVKAAWLTPDQPNDALDPIAEERHLPQYLSETITAWRLRLVAAWDIWTAGGAAQLIAAQYAAAGYVGTQVHDPFDWNRDPYNWISQFWVYLPRSAHQTGTPHRAGVGDICGAPTSICGYKSPFAPGKRAGASDAVCGQHLCGISGDVHRIVELRNIAENFRPGHVVCRQIVIELDSSVCGSGVLAGSHRCGGTTATIGLGATQ